MTITKKRKSTALPLHLYTLLLAWIRHHKHRRTGCAWRTRLPTWEDSSQSLSPQTPPIVSPAKPTLTNCAPKSGRPRTVGFSSSASRPRDEEYLPDYIVCSITKASWGNRHTMPDDCSTVRARRPPCHNTVLSQHQFPDSHHCKSWKPPTWARAQQVTSCQRPTAKTSNLVLIPLSINITFFPKHYIY